MRGRALNLGLGFNFITLSSSSSTTNSFAVKPSRGLFLSLVHSNSKRSLSSLSRGRQQSSTLHPSTSPFKLKASSCSMVEEMESPEIQRIKDDPSSIQSMTVPELRATLRSVGIAARGRKSDLVSALQRFIDNKQLDGHNLGEGDEQVSSVAVDVIPPKKKSKIASEISGGEKSRRTVLKSPPLGVKAVQVVTANEKVSVITDEALVTKSSKSMVTTSSEIEAVNLVTLPHGEPWTVLAHKKPQKGWVPYNPRTMRPPPLDKVANAVRLMSWNVNGLKALLKGFSALELAQREDFDVLCLQETKLQEKDVDSIKKTLIDGYGYSFWTCSVSKLGYSGTAIVSRIKPLSVTYGLGIPEHDSEGRIVTAEFESFYLVTAYVPNSGDGLKRLSYRITKWDPALSNYLKELEKSKPVILTGDLNCAHQEIDIYNPAGNRRSAGFTNEERQSFGENFLSRGFVDTFRKQHPDVVGYTYWGYRHGGRKTNKGWRLDYFLVSESLAGKVHDSYIAPEVLGSDHCPVGLILKL